MRFVKLLRASICGAFVIFAAAPALAANVVYVSGKGNNANTCETVAAPCLTLQAAHNKVAAGGEIIILDAASYQPLTITKSISIVNDGVGVADIQQTTAGANAITINVANGIVHLRGLSLDGAGAAVDGVSVVAASSVTLVNCAARRFTNAGVYVRPNAGVTNIAVIDSVLNDNARGLFLGPVAPGQVRGVATNLQATGNSSTGALAMGAASLTVVGGAFSKNQFGLLAYNGGTIMARDTVASNNSSAGLYALGASAILRAAHSVASGNGVGFGAASGGVGETYGDNNLRGNTTSALTAGVTLVTSQ